MTEKSSFAYKLFLPLNISDFNFFVCENCNPLPPQKSHPCSYPAAPSKSWGPGEGGGSTLCILSNQYHNEEFWIMVLGRCFPLKSVLKYLSVKTSYHKETIPLMCGKNQLISFSMIQLTERNFWTDFSINSSNINDNMKSILTIWCFKSL